LHCSARDGQLYFWVQGAGPGVSHALAALGLEKSLRSSELRSGFLRLPDDEGNGFADWERRILPCPWSYWWYVYENARFRRQEDANAKTGADFRYWLVVTQFAERLLQEGSYIPGLEFHNSQWRAAWQPVRIGKDREIFRQLVDAMPDSARALRLTREDAGTVSREECLEEVLTGLVDSGVRLAADGLPRLNAAGSYGRWLSALTGPFASVAGENSVLQRLERDLAYWKAGLAAQQRQGGTLEIELREPEPTEETWPLQLSWKPEYGERAALGDADPELTSTAWRLADEAARLYPALLRLASANWRGTLGLKPEEVPEFWEHWADELESGGFSVHMPESLANPERTPVKLKARVRSGNWDAGSPFSLDALVALDWEISVDDQILGLAEVEAMAAKRSPLQKVGGRWTLVDAEGLRESARFLHSQKDRQIKLREALRLALGLVPLEASVEFEGVEAEGGFAALLAELQQGDRVQQLPPPVDLRGELRPYQIRGYSWLSFLTKFGLGACLADDMGLGKSVQTLAFLLAIREHQKAPVLLICPTSVIGNWQREAQRFAPGLKVLVHHGAQRRKRQEFREQIMGQDLVLASYPLLHRDLATLNQLEWEGIILDEAQNIKNAGAKQSQAARSLRGGFKIALTGTPVENSVSDLYSLMQFLNPGHLGNAAEFQRRFQVPIEKRGDARAGRLLKRLTGPFLLRRLKTDRAIIADLPEKLENKVFCKLTREQGRLYDDVIRRQFDELSRQTGMARRGSILATLVKLKQICNHPKQYLQDDGALKDRSGKLLRLEEMLEEVLANGEKALVFTQFAEMGSLLAGHLEKRQRGDVPFLHGGTPRETRDRMVEAFQAEGGPAVFVLSLKAGGTGLNLTAASHVFHFDRWWNPAVEDQATDRAYRIGQTKRVEVHKFLTMGTVEERIDQMLEQKKQLAEQIVDGAETWLTEMSNEELRELFALSEDAIAE
jgi:SNF2 family DNA or RNA helicase